MRFQTCADSNAKQLNVQRWAWSLEVCPRKWASDGKVVVHAHLALSRMPRFEHKLVHFTSTGLLPHCSASNPADRSKKNSTASTLFYCSADKIGKVAGAKSHEPFKDYHVNPEWTTNLLQAGKITANTARALYLLAKKTSSTTYRT